ncbi:uncharacterized protein LOC132202856 isoform X2 [Neocloeon triangulifer]|uniref:uncharacterized protein LOC132202856 isoform X2 n=1 Tax=Neocloeon triangulifer TaxID=2078957 RepID=UPI00286EFC70|nr:uncharacterized protein LOC132202856 isoform X2 [Neocloeon triangulifer]
MSRRDYMDAGPSLGYDGEDQEELDAEEDLPQCKIKRNYACAQCDFFTQNPRTYLYHLRDDHQARIKVYECPKCVYASKHSQKLQRHIHMVHVLGRQRQQQQQQQTRKPSPPPPVLQPQQEMYEEDESDGEMPMDGEDAEMEDMDMPEEEPGLADGEQQVFQCSVCPFKSYSVTLVQRHEQIAHLKKKFFRCTKCNYVTHLKARFTKHVKYHSMPMIKCDLCDFRTPYKWNLDRHYRNHQGDGEFKCPLCNFRADIKQSLTVHVQNHHLTPQQKALRGVNRRNKVGGSDAPSTELRMSDVGLVGTNPDYSDEDEEEFEKSAELAAINVSQYSTNPVPSTSGINNKKKSPPAQAAKAKYQGHQKGFGGTSDFVHPDDVLHKNGKVYHRNIKCNFCSYKAFFQGDLARHEAKHHGMPMPTPQSKQVKKRPIPNLIPLQQTSPTPSDSEMMAANILSGGHSIFGGPSIIAQSDDEQDSFANRSANTTEEFDESEEPEEEEKAEEQEDEPMVSVDSSAVKVELEEPQDLKCDVCGHESKSIDDALTHQKSHKNEEAAQRSFLGSVGLSSTRCQNCGIRCKDSSELNVHLRTCSKKMGGQNNGNGLAEDSSGDNQKSSDDHSDEEIAGLQCASCRQPFDDLEELKNHLEHCKARMMELTPEVSITEVRGAEFHPVENKGFTWDQGQGNEPSGSKEIKPALTIERISSANNINSEEDESKMDSDDDEMEPRKMNFGEVFIGIETAPGYGFVTEEKVQNPQEAKLQLTKVYKCPQCNFWASAASRFHIHLVGHLNSKPFGCSQCDYRSNWRWDVAKHIRLKGARDPLHAPNARPRVLVTDDDTSRRNYSKYAKYVLYLVVQPGPEMEALAHNSAAVSRVSPSVTSKQVSHPQMPVLQHQGSSQLSISRTPQDQMRRPLKRPAQPEPQQSKAPTGLPQNKKLLWRCKKCNYRGANKEQVLEHVRGHYTNQNQQQQQQQVKKFTCEKCPFTGKMNEVEMHKSHHQPQPGANFKCYICPFFVSTKKELYTHMAVHGVSDPEEFLNKMQSGAFSLSVTSSTASESKPPQLKPNLPDTSNMKDVPLVWACKSGKFRKMFKCRHCPHINTRKVNIVEHEKMHSSRQVWSSPDYPTVFHTCTHCNYTCNNAGVLSAHFKVHQDWYPKAHALVDPSRSDIDQVKDLGGSEVSLDNQDSLDSREGSPSVQSDNDNVDMNALNGVQVNLDEKEEDDRLLYFCSQCPARFLFSRELAIHKRFHRVKLAFHCSHCNYTARQPQHLAAHNKVHCSEYQDRTALLLMSHQESLEYPKPSLVVKDDTWVVNDLEDTNLPILKQQQSPSTTGQPQTKQHCCHLCPARFFKAVALQYHVTLHGGSGPYKCSKCDYAVKMYGNLVRHEVVHDEKENEDIRDEPPNITPAVQITSPPPSMRPMPQLQPQVPHPPISLPPDPVFGTLMHGSPEFIYPTYWKNGKLKEKRYKCHKCPSAFEKREQYKVHLGLHGSRQKYKCDRCDYSVKYYANFIQHSKKHEMNDQARQQRQEQYEQEKEQQQQQMMAMKPEMMDIGDEEEDDDDDDALKVLHEPEVLLQVTKPAVKMLPGVSSVQKQQQMMVLERRKQQQTDSACAAEQLVTSTPTFWCSSCPYNNQRRDLVEMHLKRHQQNADTKGMHSCCYCDLKVPQPQQLKEHMLLHFRIRPLPNSRRAVTFTSYDDVEIWATKLDQDEDDESQLVLQKFSQGHQEVEESNEEEEDDEVQFIDLRTGEVVKNEPRTSSVKDE